MRNGKTTATYLGCLWWIIVILQNILQSLNMLNAKIDSHQSIDDTPPIDNSARIAKWEIAPDWANWWAFDANGKAYWYANKPRANFKDGVWVSEVRTYQQDTTFEANEIISWEYSLEQRPNAQLNKLSTEPDWSKAPEWAEWFGINANGTAFWCDSKPFLQQYRYPDVWLVPRFSKFMSAQGLYDASNWVDAIFKRQQAEQVTFTAQLNTDIDGYLAGKKSFISAYVDLLLARMAKEGRFSGEVACEKSQAVEIHDVIIFQDEGDFVFAVVNQVANDFVGISFSAQQHEEKWMSQNWFDIGLKGTVIRRITELEASLFREAMEAVYG